MLVQNILDQAMHSPEILIGGVVVGYVAGTMMTKRKMKRRNGMGGMMGM